MTTMTAAMAAKATSQVVSGEQLKEITARSGEGARDDHNTTTNPQRQRQVGLG